MQLVLTIFMAAALLMLSAFLMWYVQLLVRGTTSYEQYRRRRAAKLGLDVGYVSCCPALFWSARVSDDHDRCMQAARGNARSRDEVQHPVPDLLSRVCQISSPGTKAIQAGVIGGAAAVEGMGLDCQG